MKKISEIKAVVFDLGGTLIPFGPKQFERIWERMHGFLRERIPGLSLSRMIEAYEQAAQEQRRVNKPDLRESDFEERIFNFLRYLDDNNVEDHYAEQALTRYHDAFVDMVEQQDYLREFLEKVRSHFKTGLISNFPYGPPIRSTIEELKIEDCFDSIVISAEFGLVKPHPDIFKHCLTELEVAPEESIFVGNSWKEDITGAGNVGMHTAYTVQWTGEIPPEDSDVPVLNHLTELEKILEQPE